MPTFGKPAASTALPHPPKTSHKVPMNSAVIFFCNDIFFSPCKLFGNGALPGTRGVHVQFWNFYRIG